jgi:hypothetical protein
MVYISPVKKKYKKNKSNGNILTTNISEIDKSIQQNVITPIMKEIENIDKQVENTKRKCPEGKEENPKTKRCVKTCKSGYTRDTNFECKQNTTKKSKSQSSKSINIPKTLDNVISSIEPVAEYIDTTIVEPLNATNILNTIENTAYPMKENINNVIETTNENIIEPSLKYINKTNQSSSSINGISDKIVFIKPSKKKTTIENGEPENTDFYIHK